MTDQQAARSIVERLRRHLSAIVTGETRPENDPAAEHLRHLVANAVDGAVWLPFERAPGDPGHGERLVDALAGALARDPSLADRVRDAGEGLASGPPGRDPLKIIAVAVAALVLLAGIVYGTNALLGSGGEDEAADTAREFLVASLAGDNPRMCELTTPELRAGTDCAQRTMMVDSADVDELEDVIDRITDVTVYPRDDGTASVTCVMRWTVEDVRRVQGLRVKAGASAAPISPAEVMDTTGQFEMRKSGDGWIIYSADFRR
ncbi:hypothetical protein [Actinomadura algeriensis]|uniref:Nuclear transport factor 2 family protein n=1 Tax=Actinomadura algeriensis TaxID=1679523 RepID=A0ABR9JPX4_9ACTN|nr:hypothetical protein [Actinomadura algeriensis]MBE1532629.1 hypothetical protein [Actinomadura algeriensis]